MIKSEILYDRLAPYFSSYSKRKQLYLDSIDKIIIGLIDRKGKNMLDVGAGDGIRGNKIFKNLRFKKIVSIDNSSKMISLYKRRFKSKAYKLDISSDDTTVILDKFDVITCLWNVLGHIPTQGKRIKALINMKEFLKDDGRIFIDVSSRYNAKYYGWIKALSNIIKDLMFPFGNNGDFGYKLRISDSISIPSSNHFFTPHEMKTLIEKAGLSIDRQFYVNYSTGIIESTFLKGSIFYVLKMN